MQASPEASRLCKSPKSSPRLRSPLGSPLSQENYCDRSVLIGSIVVVTMGLLGSLSHVLELHVTTHA